jgi:hypothetical protein
LDANSIVMARLVQGVHDVAEDGNSAVMAGLVPAIHVGAHCKRSRFDAADLPELALALTRVA